MALSLAAMSKRAYDNEIAYDGPAPVSAIGK